MEQSDAGLLKNYYDEKEDPISTALNERLKKQEAKIKVEDAPG